MKKRVLSFLLMVSMVIPMLTVSGVAVGTATEAYKPETIETHYFYDQLNDRAKAIYNKLLNEFSGSTKEQKFDGTKVIDLMGVKYGSDAADGKANQEIITEDDIENYRKGNKDIFNDFCAAKDALDLDHSELWWIDSGYLTFRVTSQNAEPDSDLTAGYHVLIGPGRGDTYLLGGKKIDQLQEKIKAADKAVDAIVKEAVKALNEAEEKAGKPYSGQDRIAFLTTSAHDQITKKLHYRYEIECREGNAPYIRTLYGIVTHEGVCEAYARTLQVVLTKLGIECVLIHGVQTKGTPEDHMWNAVNIPEKDANGNSVDHWYAVDATWDDPLTANWDGTRDLKFNNGDDGKETNTYLLVGQSLVGEYWKPSGYVSTGNFEFKYPTIETAAYSGATVFGDDNGLKVKYSTGGSVEEAPAGVYTVTFRGWNAAEAAKHGFYFMIKMYDYHPDGTADVMEEWYYTAATINLTVENPYFGDFKDGLRFSSASCEYIEVAVTSRAPDHIDKWTNDPKTNYLSSHPDAGYFNGDESDIVAQSGMLYNVNSTYEAPPYVKTQTPAPNGNSTAGAEYRFQVTYDDLLYHILPDRSEAQGEIALVAEDAQVIGDKVQVRYTTVQEDLHAGDGRDMPHQVVGELPFDMDRDGVVDMDNTKNTYVDFQWIYASDPEEDGGWGITCPNEDHHGADGKCDVEKGCPIVGVAFNFRASDQWIDDITNYNFTIEGVVGSRSGKYPNNFSTTARVPGLCPVCYRSQGIDWNLWGQPTLLDAPENLDLLKMAEEGGTDAETLKQLREEMNVDDLNGRLMLVVEDKSKGSGSREDYEKINGALEESSQVEGKIAFSSVFEINFNRICPAVKLKPNKGQSLRVQVGYPAGITYEDLENYDLKAFHFVRCSNDGEEYWCDEVKTEMEGKTEAEKAEILKNHDWGEHIVKTEQITLIPTPYGIVIMCDAFSPFEIVAVKKDSASPAAIAAETKYNVIVVSGDNGYVEYTKDGKTFKAVGDDGNLEFGSGDSFTFTVKPASGYVVDTVSFGGKEIKVTDDKFTLSTTGGEPTVTKNDVLNVTFIPTSVKEAEAEDYGSTVVAKVCSHSKTNITKAAEEATCTKAGKTAEIVCTECGMTIQHQTEVPAKGHTPATANSGADKFKAGTAANCTSAGSTAEVHCTVCNAKISSASTVQALGHIFTDYQATGEKTCKGEILEATCDRDGCDVKDTRYDATESVPHSYTEEQIIEATCTQNQIKVKTCKWCGHTEEQEVEGTKKPHDVDPETGICKNCEEYMCANGHASTEIIPGKAATCTENGYTESEVCTVCGEVIRAREEIPAQGHKFPEHDHDVSVKCENCEEMSPTKEHTPVEIPGKPATCTEQGLTTGVKCSVCGDIITPQETISALGHDFDVDSIEWTWSTDGLNHASATVTCKRGDCGHKETFTATVTESVTKDAKCGVAGEETLTATVTINDKEYHTTKSTEIPALEHNVEKYTPDKDATCAQYGHESGACTLCGETVTRERTELLPHTITTDPEKSKPAACTEPGKNVGTCIVCGHTDTEEEIPALGHAFGPYSTVTAATCTEAGLQRSTCSRCGAAVTRSIPALGHDFVDGVCTRCGQPEHEQPERPKHPVVNTYTGFTDVPAGEWYEEELKFAYERNLILGTDFDKFSPEENLTRVQWMILLARFDFQDAGWSANVDADSMAWAVAKGITDGSDPEGAITREQMVTMLWRYFGCPTVEADLSGYTDAGDISDYAVEAFKWAFSEHIIGGVSATELAPQNLAQRSEAAAIFARFVKNIEGE